MSKLKKYYPPFPKQRQDAPGLTSKMRPLPDHGEISYKGSNRLLKKRVLMTGGDSGIGRSCVIAFLREGAEVFINYLPEEESDVKSLEDFMQEEGKGFYSLPGDIRDEAFCVRLVQEAVNEMGGIDVLVHCAAKQHAVKSILDVSSEQFDSTLKTNIYSMFWITKAALPHMRKNSCIITTSSCLAYDPEYFLLDYSLTKAAIVNFTKTLAKQLASKGIRVNSVAPGPIWTPLQPSGGWILSELPQLGAYTPMGRPGEPGEISPLFVLLASDESSYCTGQTWGCDGGLGSSS